MPVKTRLERLYWAHRLDAVRLAYFLTRDDQAAEDLAQEAFIRVYSRFGDLREQGAFLAYLRRTIINLSKDHHRKLQRERGALEALGRLELRESDYESSGEDDNILVAAALLPRRQFIAIVLRYCEGLSEIETAEVIQCSVSAVKSLTNRGLVTLRRNLEESDAGLS